MNTGQHGYLKKEAMLSFSTKRLSCGDDRQFAHGCIVVKFKSITPLTGPQQIFQLSQKRDVHEIITFLITVHRISPSPSHF
jgi:hypothetical protein